MHRNSKLGLVFFLVAGMACHYQHTMVVSKKNILIQTYPSGAAVFFQDSLIGYTPVEVANVQGTSRLAQFKFLKQGYYLDSVKFSGKHTIFRELIPICIAQNRQDIRCRRDYLIWDEHLQLKWEYFEGIVPLEKQSKNADLTVSAFTNSGLSVYHRFTNDSLHVFVYSFFDRNASWSKEKQASEKANKLLKHEQGHFDISEIYARKLRKDIAERPFASADTVAIIADLDSRIEAIGRSCKKAQLDYDEYTYNHLYRHYQAYWDEIIATSLKEMEHYKTPLIRTRISNN